MKTRGLYKDVKLVTIGKSRKMLQEHKTLNYFRFGSCNIPAMSADEAIQKFTECQLKREAQKR